MAVRKARDTRGCERVAFQLDESFPWLALYSIVQLRLTEPRSGSESEVRRSSSASTTRATDTIAPPIHSIMGMGMSARYRIFNRWQKTARLDGPSGMA